jgi:hypothetical protein
MRIQQIIGLVCVACLAVVASGCGSKDEAPASTTGAVVGTPTPGGGAITSTPVQGRQPRMHP